VFSGWFPRCQLNDHSIRYRRVLDDHDDPVLDDETELFPATFDYIFSIHDLYVAADSGVLVDDRFPDPRIRADSQGDFSAC
jgi:hypothetical protein